MKKIEKNVIKSRDDQITLTIHSPDPPSRREWLSASSPVKKGDFPKERERFALEHIHTGSGVNGVI